MQQDILQSQHQLEDSQICQFLASHQGVSCHPKWCWIYPVPLQAEYLAGSGSVSIDAKAECRWRHFKHLQNNPDLSKKTNHNKIHKYQDYSCTLNSWKILRNTHTRMYAYMYTCSDAHSLSLSTLYDACIWAKCTVNKKSLMKICQIISKTTTTAYQFPQQITTNSNTSNTNSSNTTLLVILILVIGIIMKPSWYKVRSILLHLFVQVETSQPTV